MRTFAEETTEFFVEAGRLQGIDEGISIIFAKVYMHPGEIALDELARSTGYSLASISNKVRLLESIGACKLSRKPGSKKIYVYMEKDFLPLMKKNMVEKHLAAINLGKERIPHILKKFEGQMKSEEQKQQYKILENYHKQLGKADKLLKQIIALMDKME